ncbi:hypothetical protein Aple_056370 [Acrocarpospora pleiomorpha]|uniref:Uncharacterized protein n=1 Tax=Acrocarpospora pleiomorpha TaxID=90975 RepID=A0A5M3XWT0_9ACTN|nr:hypothetical protein Aple_056370 [Acrocarpospora pleiomorpha]
MCEGLAALGDLLGDALSPAPSAEPPTAAPGNAGFTAPEPGNAEPPVEADIVEPAAWPQPTVSSTDATAAATTIGRAIGTAPLP